MEFIKQIINANKKLALGLSAFALLTSVGAATMLPSMSADAAAKDCLRHKNADAKLVQENMHVNANFKVPKECKGENFTVSLVVYKLNDGNWENKVNNQYIFNSKTMVVKYDAKDIRKAINVNVPQCAYQADLVLGNPVDISTGAPQNHILGALVGGNRVPCETPEVPEGEDVCPNIDGMQADLPEGYEYDENGNCVIIPPETPETPNTPSTVKRSDVKPSDLPNTGPGAVVATFAGVSSLSSILYAIFTRRFS